MPRFQTSGQFLASSEKAATIAPSPGRTTTARGLGPAGPVAVPAGTAPASRPAPGGTQSTQRLLTLLDQFSTERPTHTVEGLSEAIGVPRSTVYRLVSLLKAYELLEQAGESKYQLGPKAIMMGYVARSTVDLADVWRPGLEELAGTSRETALVLRRIGDAAVCIDRIECDHPVRLSFAGTTDRIGVSYSVLGAQLASGSLYDLWARIESNSAAGPADSRAILERHLAALG